jgi:hypothetical protein
MDRTKATAHVQAAWIIKSGMIQFPSKNLLPKHPEKDDPKPGSWQDGMAWELPAVAAKQGLYRFSGKTVLSQYSPLVQREMSDLNETRKPFADTSSSIPQE